MCFSRKSQFAGSSVVFREFSSTRSSTISRVKITLLFWGWVLSASVKLFTDAWIVEKLEQQLPTPHNTIETALRQTRIVRTNFPCQLVGFGRQSNTTVVWRTRQAVVTQNTADRAACRIESNIHANRIAESQICVVSSAAAGPCAGNLGSGLYCDGFLTGVLSAGITCTAVPSVYQQVRAFNGWIDEQFTRNDIGNAAGTVPFNVKGIPRRTRV